MHANYTGLNEPLKLFLKHQNCHSIQMRSLQGSPYLRTTAKFLRIVIFSFPDNSPKSQIFYKIRISGERRRIFWHFCLSNQNWSWKRPKFYEWKIDAYGSVCGSVGRVVVSYIRDPQFESRLRQILLTTNCIKSFWKDEKKVKMVLPNVLSLSVIALKMHLHT